MMKRLALVSCFAAALAVAGCGSDNSTSPSTTTVYTVQLNPANEVPPVTNAESSGRGTAVITVHKDSNTIDFNVSMNSFPNGTVIRAAHIHPGAAGTAGGVLVNTGLSSPLTLANGSGTFTFNGVAATADQVNSIVAAPQNFYFNIHSATNGGGVARGQLQ
jgi:CHRD domain-containing protein